MRNIMTTDHHAVHMNATGACGVRRMKMIVIETCPKCGRDLETVMIATYPPIPKKMCMRCGWCWEGKREDVVRIPFKDTTEEVYDKYYDTAGNYHYTGTITGHHVIKKDDET